MVKVHPIGALPMIKVHPVGAVKSVKMPHVGTLNKFKRQPNPNYVQARILLCYIYNCLAFWYVKNLLKKSQAENSIN